MGMKSLKWEGIGTKNLFPHTSNLDQFSRLCTVHLRAKQQTDHAASDVRNNRPHLTVFGIA